MTVGIINWDILQAGLVASSPSKGCGAHSQENTNENKELPYDLYAHKEYVLTDLFV